MEADGLLAGGSLVGTSSVICKDSRGYLAPACSLSAQGAHRHRHVLIDKALAWWADWPAHLHMGNLRHSEILMRTSLKLWENPYTKMQVT